MNSNRPLYQQRGKCEWLAFKYQRSCGDHGIKDCKWTPSLPKSNIVMELEK